MLVQPNYLLYCPFSPDDVAQNFALFLYLFTISMYFHAKESLVNGLLPSGVFHTIGCEIFCSASAHTMTTYKRALHNDTIQLFKYCSTFVC